jgi:hypothetical protein
MKISRSRKCAAMMLALALLVVMATLLIVVNSRNSLSKLSTENYISKPHHQRNEEKIAPPISQFNQLTQNYADATYNPPKEDWKKRKKQKDDNEKELHYHDYAIFIVMYHKTGFVLTRQLKLAVSQLEIETHRPDEKNEYNDMKKLTSYGIDLKTGERFAFDTIGGWTKSAFAPRRHFSETHCPRGYRSTPFQIKRGQLYLQESPDFFCDVKELETSILARKAKIIHFVRNPFDMVMSNYLYHSQKPTPEEWVHRDDPCHAMYDDGKTLASNVLPSIGTDEINEEYFSNIIKMCRSLFQSKPSMRNSTFYEHLLELDAWDGLRLATAQMIAASGDANNYLAGGDVARMANNIVKFKELQSYMPSDVEVLTLSTEEFIKSAGNSTMKFLDFVFGANNTIISREKRWEAALSQQKNLDKAFDSPHVTQSSTTEEKENKEQLKELLHSDKDLAPILKLTESLVNEALAASSVKVFSNNS